MHAHQGHGSQCARRSSGPSWHGLWRYGRSRVCGHARCQSEKRRHRCCKSRTSVENWLRNTANCTVFTGTASFESPNTLRVGDDLLETKQTFLNVGARPTVPKMKGTDTVPFLTSTGILDLDELPQHLVVIGGGYVGLEFAQMFRRFGSEVTVVDTNPRLAMHEDEDASKVIREVFGGRRRQASPQRHLHSSPKSAKKVSQPPASIVMMAHHMPSVLISCWPRAAPQTQMIWA